MLPYATPPIRARVDLYEDTERGIHRAAARRRLGAPIDDAGGAHWVLIQYARLCLAGALEGGARTGDHDLDLLGELLDLARVVQEVVWVHAHEDHDRGCEGACDVGDGADRAVGAQVGDPSAAAAQGDPEG